MNKWILITLLGLTLASCGKSDNEAVIGKWRFSRMVANGLLVVSDNQSEQQKIVDQALNEVRSELREMNQSDADYSKKLKHDMELMLRVTFDFKQDSTVLIKSNSSKKSNQTIWRYRLEEPKKQLIIYEPNRTVIYTYALKEDQLTLSDQRDSIVLKR